MVIAAITSCTNTSNPVGDAGGGIAGEEGGRARAAGQSAGQGVAGARLARGERLPEADRACRSILDQLGFNLVGYGCTTCIGNSGPLPAPVDEAIGKHDLVAASVLSGNRNFEARVHQNIKANFLMSPPLVVAFALAGRVDIDLSHEPIGKGKDGEDVFLKDIWPTLQEVRDLMQAALTPECSASSIATSPGKTRSGTKSRTAGATCINGTPPARISRSRRSSRIRAAARRNPGDQRRARAGHLW